MSRTPEHAVTEPEWDGMVLVGRVARPHGIRGDVVVNPETDFVEDRFAVGATVWTRIAGAVERLTIARAALGGRRPVLGFDGARDVPGAERLTGAELRVSEDALVPLAPGSFYVHQLVGCRVETTAGELLGSVARVEGGLGASLLVVEGPRGEVLVPFIASFCPTIDVERREIRVETPEGLLDVNAPSERTRRRRAQGRPKGARGAAAGRAS